MNYEELKKVGTKIDEYDKHDGGIYLGTIEFWFYNDNLYIRDYHSNLSRYTGRTSTDIIAEASDLDKYNDSYFLHVIGLTEEGYEKFKELAKK